MAHTEELSGLGALLSPPRWHALLDLGCPRDYGPGDVLMRQGEAAQVILALVRGRVKVSMLEPDGCELPIAVRHRGEVLGDIAVLDKKPRTATVTAVEACRVRVVQGVRFERFLAEHGLEPLVLRHSLGRLREAELYRAELIALPLAQRLSRALLRLCTEDGEGGAVVDLRMSHEELGRVVNASRNAVGQVLGHLRRLGLVEIRRQVVHIRDVDQLRKYGEQDDEGA
ncbi:Crp/Fnr family transcriptional regulator [Streptomyces sp. NPDC048172]|uniref:Crp/Fnr family transcriptional regulator n=1 Tax=Streptomyces sp. NPDC048172 TaxID=3365505 RepID=UPI003723EB63